MYAPPWIQTITGRGAWIVDTTDVMDITDIEYLDLRLGHIHVQVEAVLVAVVVEVAAPVQLEGAKTVTIVMLHKQKYFI